MEIQLFENSFNAAVANFSVSKDSDKVEKFLEISKSVENKVIS